jgi:hypothetical protein
MYVLVGSGFAIAARQDIAVGRGESKGTNPMYCGTIECNQIIVSYVLFREYTTVTSRSAENPGVSVARRPDWPPQDNKQFVILGIMTICGPS